MRTGGGRTRITPNGPAGERPAANGSGRTGPAGGVGGPPGAGRGDPTSNGGDPLGRYRLRTEGEGTPDRSLPPGPHGGRENGSGPLAPAATPRPRTPVRALLDGPRRAAAGLRELRRRLRAWRRIRFTAGGLVFTAGTFAVGFAAINTGNNLLYLLLGAMLGFITVSSWLSEQAIRDLEVERRTPVGVTVGREVRVHYEVRNRKRRLPSLAVEIAEAGLPERAFVPRVAPGERIVVRSVNTFVRRGIYPLEDVTLSTSFPFGLFFKERDVSLPGELVIWPRSDRPVRPPATGGGRIQRTGAESPGSGGSRGEYRGLRGYRPGDDPRDIHWKVSAKLDKPVIREYEQDAAETLWICLDLRGESDADRSEAAVEVAASLAAWAARGGRRFGVVAGRRRLPPGTGPGHLEVCLDLLARVDFWPDAPAPSPPVRPERCVLVTAGGRDGGSWGDVLVASVEAATAAGEVA